MEDAHLAYMSIGPVELNQLLAVGAIVEIRKVGDRLTYCGTIRSFVIKGNFVGLVLNDVAFRPFGRPRRVSRTNGCDTFEFAAYGSRLTGHGDIALKSSLGSLAHVRVMPALRRAV